MISGFFKILCVFFASIAVFSGCTGMPTAGGTTDTGNARVAAVIFTNDGKQAANASVKIVPSGYISDIGKDSSSYRTHEIRELATDESGFFETKINEPGNYSIEINDGSSSAALLSVSVPATNNTVNARTIVMVDTLKNYATVSGNAGISRDSVSKRYLLIYGLDRKIAVSKDGSFVVNNLPAGTFDMKIVSENDSVAPIEITKVKTASSESVKLPYAGWIYSKEIEINTTSTGADVAENVMNFPVLLRLSNDNFDFTRANNNGSDCRFVKNNGTSLYYEIEQWDSLNKKASIWVLIDTVYGNRIQTFKLLYGNSSAVTSERSTRVFDTANNFFGIYHFNSNVHDATSNRYHGADSSTYDSPDGIIGRARAFDGYESYINLGDLPDRPEGTISFWFKPSKTFDSSVKFSQGFWGKKSHDSINFHIILKGKEYCGDTLVPDLFGNIVTKLEDASKGYYLDSKTSSFNAGYWYYVTWNWGMDINKLYINGELEVSLPGSRPVSADANDEIGRSLFDGVNVYLGAPRYFHGIMDEFRIDKAPRNENWIRLCYINQSFNDKLVTVTK